jgi:putative DNA primase/helicase
MMSLAHAAQLLAGDVNGSRVLCPGPGHSPSDRSLSVWFRRDAADGFIVHSFAGDSFLHCRDHVRERLRIPRGADRFSPRPLQRPPATRSSRALAIWAESRSPIGTPVETYLASRGLHLASYAPGAALRFHPNCPFKGRHPPFTVTRIPAMIALVRDIVSDRPVAIHRTAITPDGRKIAIPDGPKDGRMALGPGASGAVKLSDEVTEVTTVLGIGEGIETTTSLRLIPEFGASPIWSALNAPNMGHFPVLPGIDVLWIAVDNDAAGIEAARTVAARWREAEREVLFVQSAYAGEDLNDIVEAAPAT